ncbi:hypothetical protein EDB89DRAFT_1900233 [Lactarius sanguifluus]|nr:hypothetical protein EDB89DRAFT_1900233 [Lactarius sanguifluus]
MAPASTLVAGHRCGIVREQGKLFISPPLHLPCAQIASDFYFPTLHLTVPMATATGDTDSGDKDTSDDSKAAPMTMAMGDGDGTMKGNQDEMMHQRQWDGACKCSLAKIKWNVGLQLEDSKLGWVDMCASSQSQAHSMGEQVPVTVGLGSGFGGV